MKVTSSQAYVIRYCVAALKSGQPSVIPNTMVNSLKVWDAVRKSGAVTVNDFGYITAVDPEAARKAQALKYR